MTKPANSLQKVSLMPKPSFTSKQWGQTEHDSNLLFPKLQVILVLWNKALKPWPDQEALKVHVSQAKTSFNFFFSVWEKPKGMKWEMQEPQLKQLTAGRSKLMGTIFCQRSSRYQAQRSVPMPHIFCKNKGFPIACFKKKVQLLLQLFW